MSEHPKAMLIRIYQIVELLFLAGIIVVCPITWPLWIWAAYVVNSALPFLAFPAFFVLAGISQAIKNGLDTVEGKDIDCHECFGNQQEIGSLREDAMERVGSLDTIIRQICE